MLVDVFLSHLNFSLQEFYILVNFKVNIFFLYSKFFIDFSYFVIERRQFLNKFLLFESKVVQTLIEVLLFFK